MMNEDGGDQVVSVTDRCIVNSSIWHKYGVKQASH